MPDPSPTNAHASPDPDAEGLPVHIQLPDANEFRRDQLFIQMLINGFFLAVLIVWSLFIATSRSKQVAWFSTGLAALIVGVSVVRWLLAKRVCDKARSAGQSSPDFPSSDSNAP